MNCLCVYGSDLIRSIKQKQKIISILLQYR